MIVLGVTGGIAAYKSVLLARLLVEAGHDVHIVPTEDALRFVGQPTWEAISRNPVTTSVHDDVPEVRHVALGQRADLVIVAPATANTLARMVAGLADDLLGTTLLATRAPVLVAPAMHTEMWQHPSTQHNMAVLRERGVHVVGPESGRLTGSDSGPGRMSEPEAIFEAALALTAAGDFAGVRVLVTAGGTREPIDPVRFIGNRSSGRQGTAVALAAADRGAAVQFIAANIEADVLAAARAHPRIDIVTVGSTSELKAATEAAAADADAVIMAAAVSDYRVASVADGKIRKEDTESPTIELVENPDILAGLVDARAARHAQTEDAEASPGRVAQTLVGFAAETVSEGSPDPQTELVERGVAKRRRKGVDLLAVNAVGWNEGFEAENNTLLIIDTDDKVALTATGSKREVAERLLDAVLEVRSSTP